MLSEILRVITHWFIAKNEYVRIDEYFYRNIMTSRFFLFIFLFVGLPLCGMDKNGNQKKTNTGKMKKKMHQNKRGKRTGATRASRIKKMSQGDQTDMFCKECIEWLFDHLCGC